jgi:hypothetical protein
MRFGLSHLVAFVVLLTFLGFLPIASAQNTIQASADSVRPAEDKLEPLADTQILELLNAPRSANGKKLNFSGYDLIATLDCKTLALDNDVYVDIHSPQVVWAGSMNWAMFYEKHYAEKGMVQLNLLNVPADATYLVVFRVANNVANQEFQVLDKLNNIDQKFKTGGAAHHHFSVVIDATKKGNYRPSIKNLAKDQWSFSRCSVYRAK